MTVHGLLAVLNLENTFWVQLAIHIIEMRVHGKEEIFLLYLLDIATELAITLKKVSLQG